MKFHWLNKVLPHFQATWGPLRVELGLPQSLSGRTVAYELSVRLRVPLWGWWR
jgi:hypothetical protein